MSYRNVLFYVPLSMKNADLQSRHNAIRVYGARIALTTVFAPLQNAKNK